MGHGSSTRRKQPTAGFEGHQDSLLTFLEKRLLEALFRPPRRSAIALPVFPRIGAVSVLLCEPAVRTTQTLVLFSHGNSSDLSQLRPVLQKWADTWGARVLAYDYPGYGETTGTPSEVGCCAALQVVLEWARWHAPRVVLVGYSLGTGVVSRVAAETGLTEDVLLVAPFLSVTRIAFDVDWLSDIVDRFRTYLHMPRVRARVQIIHGTKDQLIPPEHAVELREKSRNPLPLLLVRDADHATILETPEFHTAVLMLLRRPPAPSLT